MSSIYKISKYYLFTTIKAKYKNYKNYRYLEEVFRDFREQDFIKDAKDIYFELVEAVELKIHFIFVRSLDSSIYKVRIKLKNICNN